MSIVTKNRKFTYSIKAVDIAELSPLINQSVVNPCPTLCSRLGKLHGEHTIRLKENVKPFCLSTPRRVPLPLVKHIKDETERLVECGVIEPVNNPIVAVPKPSGAVRIFVDLFLTDY